MPEKSEEEKTSKPDPKNKKRFNWRKVGLWALFVLSTVLVFCLGYFSVSFWDNYFNRGSYLVNGGTNENWQIYKSEDFGFGLRYPVDWQATEVKKSLVIFKPVTGEEEQTSKEYLSLKITATGSRAETSCEKDQSKCSFYANEIFGDKTVTPDGEIIFFSNRKNDFVFTLHKYGGADLVDTFEDISQSLRFVSGSEEEENAEAT
jgi:hypothetical protein